MWAAGPPSSSPGWAFSHSSAALLLGVAQTREDGKRARTLDYLRRLYGQEFAPLNAQVMAFVRTGDTEMLAHGARLTPDLIVGGEEMEAAFYRLDIENQARVNRVLNFYEELSCSYREGLLDKPVADKMLLPAVETMWDRAEPRSAPCGSTVPWSAGRGCLPRRSSSPAWL
jgi:hypothetical protein